jgi:hypothetical protein
METPSADVCTAMTDTLKVEEEDAFAASADADEHMDACTTSADRRKALVHCQNALAVEPVSSSLATLAAALEASAAWLEAHVKASAEAVARQSSSVPAPSAKNSAMMIDLDHSVFLAKPDLMVDCVVSIILMKHSPF